MLLIAGKASSSIQLSARKQNTPTSILQVPGVLYPFQSESLLIRSDYNWRSFSSKAFFFGCVLCLLICRHVVSQTNMVTATRTSEPPGKGWNSISNSPSSSNDLIRLLDLVGSLLSQVYQAPPKSILDVLTPLWGILLSEVLANLDIHISLPLCLFELIRMTGPNPPFEDEPMKKAFQVIVSSFHALPDTASQS